MSVPAVKKVAFALEEKLDHNSPLNSITRFSCFYTRTKEPVTQAWIFNTIEDLYNMNIFNADHRMSETTLTGGANGKKETSTYGS